MNKMIVFPRAHAQDTQTVTDSAIVDLADFDGATAYNKEISSLVYITPIGSDILLTITGVDPEQTIGIVIKDEETFQLAGNKNIENLKLLGKGTGVSAEVTLVFLTDKAV